MQSLVNFAHAVGETITPVLTESAFMEKARANLAKHSPRVILPKLYKHLSSTSILTQERVHVSVLPRSRSLVGLLGDPF